MAHYFVCALVKHRLSFRQCCVHICMSHLGKSLTGWPELNAVLRTHVKLMTIIVVNIWCYATIRLIKQFIQNS